MMVLVVNDDLSVMKGALRLLSSMAFFAVGMIPTKPDGAVLIVDGRMRDLDQDPLDLVREAHVILLDHHMPGRDGDTLLASWKESGIDLSEKRVVGISLEHDQPYLTEKISPGEMYEFFQKMLEGRTFLSGGCAHGCQPLLRLLPCSSA